MAVGVFEGLMGYREGGMGLTTPGAAETAESICRDPERTRSVRSPIADRVRRIPRVVKVFSRPYCCD
jgi:hypothetical protein